MLNFYILSSSSAVFWTTKPRYEVEYIQILPKGMRVKISSSSNNSAITLLNDSLTFLTDLAFVNCSTNKSHFVAYTEKVEGESLNRTD